MHGHLHDKHLLTIPLILKVHRACIVLLAMVCVSFESIRLSDVI